MDVSRWWCLAQAKFRTEGPAEALQLWISLPEGIEDGPAQGIYISPEVVPKVDVVNVLLGSYKNTQAPFLAPSPMNYYFIDLPAGQTWEYQPPDNHTVAWMFVQSGKVESDSQTIQKQLAIFDESSRAIQFTATLDAGVLFGTAIKHPHPLVLGNYSVHTNIESKIKGEKRIQEIGQELKNSGRR